jgi:DNA-binding MarR family transcriptional regulator
MSRELKQSESIGYLVFEVARLMKRRFEDEAKLHGFTLAQWRALAEIARGDGISQVALAAALDVDQMTVSGIVSRLEKRGLIARDADPNDSRAKLARLTSEGQALIAEAKNVGRAVYERALSGLDDSQRDHLTLGLRQIRDNLNAMTEMKENA